MALSEVRRVLKPGGIFVGMGGQAEPFHGSFFNHTAWGILAVAHATDLKVTRIWKHWDTLETISYMGSYPKTILVLLRWLSVLHDRAPILSPRRMMNWTANQKKMLALHQAGSLYFFDDPRRLSVS
jgi:SAM-dependent methyltransferase